MSNVVVVNQSPGLVPHVPEGLAIVSLVLNIFFPGIGTMTLACGPIPAPGQISLGFIQMILTFCLIGWIWAIIHSFQAIALSGSPQTTLIIAERLNNTHRIHCTNHHHETYHLIREEREFPEHYENREIGQDCPASSKVDKSKEEKKDLNEEITTHR